MKTEEILAERGSRYGSYSSNARVMQQLRDVLRSGDSWGHAPYEVKEALDSLCIKLGRIVNGDPTYLDNFQDAIGYLTLALDYITPKPGEAPLDLSGPFIPHATNPLDAGPEGTEPQNASHAVDSPRKVPRAEGIHLTQDHVGMFFKLADSGLSPVRLQVNDGPEPDRYPYKAHNRRYTEYGFVAAQDGVPLHDIVAFHPH